MIAKNKLMFVHTTTVKTIVLLCFFAISVQSLLTQKLIHKSSKWGDDWWSKRRRHADCIALLLLLYKVTPYDVQILSVQHHTRKSPSNPSHCSYGQSSSPTAAGWLPSFAGVFVIVVSRKPKIGEKLEPSFAIASHASAASASPPYTLPGKRLTSEVVTFTFRVFFLTFSPLQPQHRTLWPGAGIYTSHHNCNSILMGAGGGLKDTFKIPTILLKEREPDLGYNATISCVSSASHSVFRM